MKHSLSTMVLTANGNCALETNSNTSSKKNNATGLHEKSKRSLACDLMIIIILIVPILICEYCVHPNQRGYFCNDESIRYPYRPNTVSTTNLCIIVLLMPLCFFTLVEHLRQRYYNRWSLMAALFPGNWQMGYYCYYLFGMALTLNATEIGKFTIGRLRPHFYEVCQPRILGVTTCADEVNQDRYIENYECDGLVDGRFKESDLNEARLSFPSGHASMIWYCMVYLVIYIQHRLPNYEISYLCKFLLQFALLAFAWFVGLTRVMDNFHHWSDVLAGGLLGIICALLTTRFVAKLNSCTHSKQIVLQQRQSPLTLREVSVLTTN